MFLPLGMLEIRNISFAYDEKTIIAGLNLDIRKGQHLALVGESGCGKSTLLKLIYGLYDLDNGSIAYNQMPVLGPKFNLVPGTETMKYLAQDFDLMPFITVSENIGKFLSNIYKDQKAARVTELLDMVGMTEYARTKAKYLSGGQQQRVALARVLALEPQVLLLDEPFSQIDAFRRNQLRRDLFGYLKQKQISCIFATHDSTDILSFADEVIVMKSGQIVQSGTPASVYKKPKNPYVASLFGEVSEIPLHLVSDEKDTAKTVLCYPHQLQPAPQSRFQVTVLKSYFKGDGHLVESIYQNQKVFFEATNALSPGTLASLAYVADNP